MIARGSADDRALVGCDDRGDRSRSSTSSVGRRRPYRRTASRRAHPARREARLPRDPTAIGAADDRRSGADDRIATNAAARRRRDGRPVLGERHRTRCAGRAAAWAAVTGAITAERTLLGADYGCCVRSRGERAGLRSAPHAGPARAGRCGGARSRGVAGRWPGDAGRVVDGSSESAPANPRDHAGHGPSVLRQPRARLRAGRAP